MAHPEPQGPHVAGHHCAGRVLRAWQITASTLHDDLYLCFILSLFRHQQHSGLRLIQVHYLVPSVVTSTCCHAHVRLIGTFSNTITRYVQPTSCVDQHYNVSVDNADRCTPPGQSS